MPQPEIWLLLTSYVHRMDANAQPYILGLPFDLYQISEQKVQDLEQEISSVQ